MLIGLTNGYFLHLHLTLAATLLGRLLVLHAQRLVVCRRLLIRHKTTKKFTYGNVRDALDPRVNRQNANKMSKL
jgi:uncharacterized membrane protein